MLLIILLVIISWVIVPGLLTGWMLREHGWRFVWGLLLGALLGPLGTLAALAFIYAADRKPARHRPQEQARGFRPFYTVPFIGRLHVSTAWSMAGVVVFLCAWMVGGLGYEFYSIRYRRAAPNPERAAKNVPQQSRSPTPANITPSQLQASQKSAANAQGNPTAPPGGQLLSGLTAQSGQVAQVSDRPENAPAQMSQTPADTTTGPAEGAAPPAAVAVPSSSPTPAPATPAPVRPPTQTREAAVSEVTRGLGSGGHKVHVAISGDARTATLSVSGPTLTRQAGNQLLGNGRTRQTLKGAGIRIVVMINGQESWTYIL